MDAGRGACGAGFKSLLHRYAQHCHNRIVTLHTARPHIDWYSEGGNGAKEPPGYGKTPYPGGLVCAAVFLYNHACAAEIFYLTKPHFPAILPAVNAMTGTSSAAQSCQESPRLVEGGEGGGVNTSPSSGPKAVTICD